MIDYRHFRSADGMGFAHFRVPEDNSFVATLDNWIELTPAEWGALDYVHVRDIARVPHFDIIGYPPDGDPVHFNILSCEVAGGLEMEYKWHFMRNKE